MQTKHKVKGSNTHLSIITLNTNGLNSPIKRHRLGECIRNVKPCICCLQETHLTIKDRHHLRVRGWKKVFQANGTKKQVGVAILISEKIDLKVKLITRDKEGHYILVMEQ